MDLRKNQNQENNPSPQSRFFPAERDPEREDGKRPDLIASELSHGVCHQFNGPAWGNGWRQSPGETYLGWYLRARHRTAPTHRA